MVIKSLSRYQKYFKDMTKEDILDFLNTRRKSMLEDPSQKWIGSYNGRQIVLNKFFRYYDNSKDVEARRYYFDIVRDVIDIDEDFSEIIVKTQGNYIEKNLFPIFESLLKRSLDDLMSNEDNKTWLPQNGEKAYCKRHRKSHEAEEFFSSILEIAISEYLESNKYKKFLVNNLFSEERTKIK